ncbi:unnamed protein product [Sympodiomycopsis kandeliae]
MRVSSTPSVVPLAISLLAWSRQTSGLPNQIPFTVGGELNSPHPPSDGWDPLEHMSGIAPYHDAPGADITPPHGCKVSSAAFLIRHSCIGGNDDEDEEYMKPFRERLYQYREQGGSFENAGPLAFLQDWESPVTEDTIEQITKPGIDDAFGLGKRLRKLYPHLFPDENLGKKSRKKNGVKESFKVWTASSSRDVDTAKAWIRGAFPKRHEGDDGEGDGKYLQLIQVPNKDADWSQSLTPHKVCPKFSKAVGKPDAHAWLGHYGPEPLKRLQGLLPDFDWQLNDIIAAQMYCGYETVINGVGTSEFCKEGLFTEEEFQSFGYFNDLFYHRILGYGSDVGPYLGLPWVNTSLHNLLASDRHHKGDKVDISKKGPKLPDPDHPPEESHRAQRFFAYFTHRESPPSALVALGIWNQTFMPTDQAPADRVWQTSHVLPFLGHVSIERLECGNRGSEKGSFARVIVNGAAQKLPRKELADGPGGSCKLDRFEKYVQERAELYGDFEAGCKADDQE